MTSKYTSHTTVPTCPFGDGCLIKLTDDNHNAEYIHTKSILPVCRNNDPVCKQYKLARDFILNGSGVMTREIKAAQNHVALCYHRPIYGVTQPRKRSRSVSITSKKDIPGLAFHRDSRISSATRKSSVGPPSGSTEIDGGDLLESPGRDHTLSSHSSNMGSDRTMDTTHSTGSISSIPKLDLPLARSLPSSPAGKWSPQSDYTPGGPMTGEGESLVTPKMLNHSYPTSISSPILTESSDRVGVGSPKNGVIKTPKNQSRRDRPSRGSGDTSRRKSTDEQIETLRLKLNDTIDSVRTLENQVARMGDSMSQLRDLFIKSYLDDSASSSH